MDATHRVKSTFPKRKSLQTLQPSANNKTLVGISGPHISKTPKNKGKRIDDLTETATATVKAEPVEKAETENKSQAFTGSTKSVTCAPEELSPEYWSTIAERRRLALVETVEENESLRREILKLRAELENKNNEIALLKPLANEAQHLAAILTELTGGLDGNNDVEETA